MPHKFPILLLDFLILPQDFIQLPILLHDLIILLHDFLFLLHDLLILLQDFTEVPIYYTGSWLLKKDFGCCKTPVVKTKVTEVGSECGFWVTNKTDPRKGHFQNGCTEGSFLKRMRATRTSILTDAWNGLLGNGFAQGMGQIPDAPNLHPGCTQPL